MLKIIPGVRQALSYTNEGVQTINSIPGGGSGAFSFGTTAIKGSYLVACIAVESAGVIGFTVTAGLGDSAVPMTELYSHSTGSILVAIFICPTPSIFAGTITIDNPQADEITSASCLSLQVYGGIPFLRDHDWSMNGGTPLYILSNTEDIILTTGVNSNGANGFTWDADLTELHDTAVDSSAMRHSSAIRTTAFTDSGGLTITSAGTWAAVGIVLSAI